MLLLFVNGLNIEFLASSLEVDCHCLQLEMVRGWFYIRRFW